MNFQDAHRRISRWEQANPKDAIGPTSQATGYLFAELARLGALESELFVDNGNFRNRKRLTPDPEARHLFMDQIGKADDLATRALAKSPSDTDALLAELIALGLRADYDSLIEKKMLTPLGYTKQSSEYVGWSPELRLFVPKMGASPKILLRLASSTALILSMGVVSFGQRYTKPILFPTLQESLLSLILSWSTLGGFPAVRAVPGGSRIKRRG